MNLQTNTPPAVAVSPILVCFTQLKFPGEGPDMVQDIVRITPCNQPWNGITVLHRELLMNSKKLCDCKEMMQMVVARLSKEYYQYITQREDFMAMFCHPFMAHHGLHLMTGRQVSTHGELTTMKEAFVDDVTQIVKLSTQSGHNWIHLGGGENGNKVNTQKSSSNQ